ncbi:hypothetical protein P7C73_g4063, partial [Tremellales sp. Uapishka_1]
MRVSGRLVALAITTLTTIFSLSTLLYVSQSYEYEHEHDDPVLTPARALALPKQWLSTLGRESRTKEIVKLHVLKALLEERYHIDKWRFGRNFNGPALQRLADCMESDSCGPGEENVVILATFHFGNAKQGMAGGEDIWAHSTIEAFEALNYTLLYTYGNMDTLMIYQAIPDHVKTILWEGESLKKCILRNATNHEEMEDWWAAGKWQKGESKGCIQREGFEDGIPIWKSFVFHFWKGSQSPLGPQWTLSPEDYAQWNDGVGNNYLGYSIETRCRQTPFRDERQHRGLTLGKRLEYFQGRDFYWPGMLGPIAEKMPYAWNKTLQASEPFEMIATASTPGKGYYTDGIEPLPEPGITNLGHRPMLEWFDLVAESKFMLGVGRPLLSPSPYDALCFGVPFINVIFQWDRENPDDWTKWNTQHNALRPTGPPYVYHVQKNNREQLEAAIAMALENPIDRYIPPHMRKEAVQERHRTLIETDWRKRARDYVQREYLDGGKEFNFML